MLLLQKKFQREARPALGGGDMDGGIVVKEELVLEKIEFRKGDLVVDGGTN